MILLNVLAAWNFANAVEWSVMQIECKNGLVGILLSVCWRPVLCIWKWNELNSVGADCCWNVQAAFAFLVGGLILSPQGPSLICREGCMSGSMLAAGMCWPCMWVNWTTRVWDTLGTAVYKLDYEIYSGWCMWPVKGFNLELCSCLSSSATMQADTSAGVNDV